MTQEGGFEVSIPFQTARALLQDAAERDRTTARRIVLTEILWHERYLGRGALMERTAQRLGAGCFGDSAWEDTFNRDMQAVREALAQSGADLAYSRTTGLDGYYLRGQGRLHSQIIQEITRQTMQIDLRQLSIYHSLGLVQRVRQALRASEQAAWEARYARGVRSSGAASITLAGFIQNLAQAVRAADTACAFSGHAAGWAWAEPRPAQRVDLMALSEAVDLPGLLTQLRKRGFTPPEGKTKEKTRPGRLLRIEVTHPMSEWQACLFIPPPHDTFFRAAVSRAVELDYGREIGALRVLSAEYLALWELYAYAQKREPAHVRALAALLLHQQEKLDEDMITMQAEQKGWLRLWEEMRLQAENRLGGRVQDNCYD